MQHTTLEDAVDTQREVQDDIRAILESLSLSVGANTTIQLCEDRGDCYSIGDESRMRNTEEIVNETLRLMMAKSGSRLSRFDDYSHLALLANIEDQQRLQNVKRRQFKFKIGWYSVGSAKRNRFVKALKLSPIPDADE